jgi:hypothetical protein
MYGCPWFTAAICNEAIPRASDLPRSGKARAGDRRPWDIA